MIETIATLVAITATVGGTIFAFSRGIFVALAKLDQRFDTEDELLAKLSHRQDLERTAIQGQLDQIRYQMEMVLEYRIKANTELIQHKAKRLEAAIASLSGALERVSEGRYVPRSEGWPTDDPPTEIKSRSSR